MTRDGRRGGRALRSAIRRTAVEPFVVRYTSLACLPSLPIGPVGASARPVARSSPRWAMRTAASIVPVAGFQCIRHTPPELEPPSATKKLELLRSKAMPSGSLGPWRSSSPQKVPLIGRGVAPGEMRHTPISGDVVRARRPASGRSRRAR